MEEYQIVVDVQASPLSESMQRQLDTFWGKTKFDTLWGDENKGENCIIFRTPHNISQGKKNLFEPSVISIGPFHCGKPSLQAWQEQKWQFLHDFLSREDHISLDLCISEMKLLEERTRRCYSETIDLESNAFVEMMLLDGCFVLEYFLIFYEENLNDLLRVIYSDLLLLDNQIPFFIVEKLYEIGLQQKDNMGFVKSIAFTFFSNVITDQDFRHYKIPDPPAEIHHLVHLCYHYLVPNPRIPVVFSSKPFGHTIMFSANRIIKGLLHRFRLRPVRRGRSPHSTSGSLSGSDPEEAVSLSSTELITRPISAMMIPSATELRKKGLKFKPKSNPKHMLDISFEHGVLQIPRLAISDETQLIFANLMLFEDSKYRKRCSPFLSFLVFLDNLVNTPHDVRILQECGIVENWLGSEEELTCFINQVSKGNFIGRYHYLAELYTEVNRYIATHRIKLRWNRQLEKLFLEYFSSPWKAISVIAAIILLVLTCIQTFYAVYAYKFPPSS